MKKVLILSISGTSLIDYRIISQAIFLKQNGFDVTVLELSFPISENSTINNINFIYIEKSLCFKFIEKFSNIKNKIIREILRPIKRIANKLIIYISIIYLKRTLKNYKPNVIISRDITPHLSLINEDIIIVNDLHEVYYYQTAEMRKDLKNIQDQSLSRTSFIINVTPQIAQSFYKDFWDKNKSIIIPNAPLLSLLQPTAPTFAKSEKVRFLIHGAYIKNRDVVTKKILLSFAKAPENAILYVRFLNQNHTDVVCLREEVLKIDTQKKIIFLDPIQSGIAKEVESMIDNFDVGIISLDAKLAPQYNMASPNRLGTYIHAGLAVISSQSDFVAETIKSANCGLIYEQNKILDCINYLCQNPNTVIEMRKAAFTFAKSTFNYDNYGRQLLERLNSMPTPSTVSCE